jgi:hypothetical protein
MCLMCMQLSRMSNTAREEPAAVRTGQTVAAAKEDYAGMEAVVVSPSSASAGYDGTTSTGLLPSTVATWLLRPKIRPLLQKVTSSVHESGADLADLNRWE